MPRLPVSLVRTMSMSKSATPAWVIHAFVPVST